MKLEGKKIEVIGALGEESYAAQISQADLAKMWDMLQNPYKNNIGSIVREITSNCFDSHSEAGVTDAVQILYGKDSSGFYVSFIDVGVGLSSERVKDIYTQYLKSTKEGSNDFIGAFGIGSKSPLSYQDLFYINTRYNGIEYNYMMRKGEVSPVIDLLKKKMTTERNGTEIKLYIKSEEHLLLFLQETQKQLLYFNNVDIVVDQLESIYGSYYSRYSTGSMIQDVIRSLKHDYTIIQGNNFLYRPDQTAFKELHIAIGVVAYPIDWKNIGMSPILSPVALKFNIGDLAVIQTREDIRYTDENIQKIKQKITELKEEFTEMKRNESLNVELSATAFLKESPFRELNTIVFKIATGELDENNEEIKVEYHLGAGGLIDTTKIPGYQVKDLDYVFKSIDDNNTVYQALNLFTFDTAVGYKSKYLNYNFFKGYFDAVKRFKSNGSLCENKKALTNAQSLSIIRDTLKTFINSFQNINNVINNKYKAYILVDKNTKYSTKTNKYIAEVLFKDTSTDDIYFIQHSKPEFHLLELKAYYKGNKILSKVFSFRQFVSFVNLLIKENTKDVENTFVKYSDIVVDEQWWKEYSALNRKVTSYDKTLLAIERADSYNVGVYDRTNVRETLSDYIQPSTVKIVLSKDQKQQFTSNQHNYRGTNLEYFVLFQNALAKKGILKQSITLDILSNRNYEKVLKDRTPSSNIFTIEEYFKDQKMQIKYIGKIITAFKIVDDLEKNKLFKYGKTWQEIVSIKFIFSEHVQKLIEQIDIFSTTYKNQYHQLQRLDIYKLIHEDLENIALEQNILDQELLHNYNQLVLFLKQSGVLAVNNTYQAIANIITKFKPENSKFRFANVFYKQGWDDQSIVDYGLSNDLFATDHIEYARCLVDLSYEHRLNVNESDQSSYYRNSQSQSVAAINIDSKKAILILLIMQNESRKELKKYLDLSGLFVPPVKEVEETAEVVADAEVEEDADVLI